MPLGRSVATFVVVIVGIVAACASLGAAGPSPSPAPTPSPSPSCLADGVACGGGGGGGASCCAGSSCVNPCSTSTCFDERRLCTPGLGQCCEHLGYFCSPSGSASDPNTYCAFDASKPTPPPPTPPPAGCVEQCVSNAATAPPSPQCVGEGVACTSASTCCAGTRCRNPCQAECFDERHLCSPGANECCEDLGYFCLDSLDPSDPNTYCRFDASKPTPPPTPPVTPPPGGCVEQCVREPTPSPPSPSPGPTRPVATPPPCIARRSACVPGGTGEQACCGAEDNPQSSECLPDKPSVSDGDHICQPMGGFPEFRPTPEPTPDDDGGGVPVGAIVGGVVGGLVALALLIALIVFLTAGSKPAGEPLMMDDPLSQGNANNPLYESRTQSTDNVLYRPPEM